MNFIEENKNKVSDEDDNYGSLLFEPDPDEIEDDNYGSIMFDDDY